jgi:hypothetical protein
MLNFSIINIIYIFNDLQKKAPSQLSKGAKHRLLIVNDQ